MFHPLLWRMHSDNLSNSLSKGFDFMMVNRLYQAISVISSRIIIISQWNEASHEIMGIQNE